MSPIRVSDAVNEAPAPAPALARRASRSQYALVRNSRRASSRSTTRRTATLCTRPALSPVWTFFHSTGDTM